MTKDEHISYWLETAQHDLDTAEALFKVKKYDACLFFGHLVLEKTLKALWVKSNKEEKFPPKIHNLLKLASQTNARLNKEQKAFLGLVDTFHLETRYPDYRMAFYKQCTQDFTDKNLSQIKELYQCLHNQAH